MIFLVIVVLIVRTVEQSIVFELQKRSEKQVSKLEGPPITHGHHCVARGGGSRMGAVSIV